jgi:imidazolonepropionase-like amidohydrolase
VANEDQARQVVRDLTVGRGIDQLKVVIEHASSPTPAAAVLAALVDESHRSGRPVIAHASGGMKTSDLVGAGFDELVHVPWSGLDDAGFASTLVERKLRVTTTVSNFEAYKGAAGEEFFLFGFTYNPGIRQAFERAVRSVRVFADAGVKLAVGSTMLRCRLMIRAHGLVRERFTNWTSFVVPGCHPRRSS